MIWLIGEVEITLSDIMEYIADNNITKTKVEVSSIINLANNINIEIDRVNNSNLAYPIILLKEIIL